MSIQSITQILRDLKKIYGSTQLEAKEYSGLLQQATFQQAMKNQKIPQFDSQEKQQTVENVQIIYEIIQLEVKKYSNLFQQAIESQELPQDYDSQKLHQLKEKVDELSKNILHNSLTWLCNSPIWRKLRSDLDSVLFSEYALKYPLLVKATIQMTDEGPERTLLALTESLGTIDSDSFISTIKKSLIIPLCDLNIDFRFKIGEKCNKIISLNPPLNCNPPLYSPYSSDQWYRLRLLLKKFLPQAFHEYWVYAASDFLLSTLEIKIAADRLSLEKEQFKTEMKALLAYCKKAETVKIHQKNSPYFLTFTRQRFEEWIESGPEIFEPRTVKCKNDEKYQIDADFYLEMMEYLSKRSISDKYKSIREIDLSDFDKTTIDQAHFWFKTNQYPVLTWEDELKLLTLLQFMCSGSKWHQIVQERLAERTLSFSEQDLKGMNWNDLMEELAAYPSNYVKLGQEYYSRERLEVLSKKSSRPKALSTLARPIYFKFQNGAIVEGSFDWFITLDQMLEHSDQDNPILIEQDSKLLDAFRSFCSRPLDQPFEALKRLEVFLSCANIYLPHLGAALQACTRIKLGDASKELSLYWKEISDGLKYYPQAKYIELDGCQISWTRGTVEAFIAHGTIELRDLSETVDIKLTSELTLEIVFYRMSKAEWKSFSVANPSQYWLESGNFLPDWALKLYLAYGFNTSPLLDRLSDPLSLRIASFYCNPIATPYFRRKINAVLGVPLDVPQARRDPSERARAQSLRNPKMLPLPMTNWRKAWTVLTAAAPLAVTTLWARYAPNQLKFRKSVFSYIASMNPGISPIISSYKRIKQVWQNATMWKRAAALIAGTAAGFAATTWVYKNK
jgi:hypothetical protein